MSGCLSEFTLDDREVHGATDPAADAHLEACASCRARLAERRARAAEFESSWATPTWTRIAVAGRARRPGWRRWFTFAFPFASLAAVATVWWTVAPPRPPGAVGPTPKGRALAEIVCRRGDRTFVVGPGDEVAPGDALRFRPLPIWSEARYVQVGSVDGTGTYAPFYPPGDDGASVPLPAPGTALEGSIRLDDAPGPERLFVVLSTAPLPAREVARAALAHASRGEDVDRIGGARVLTTWIVLPKRGGQAARP